MAMRPKRFLLTAAILWATIASAYGQSLVYCPTAPEERHRRCSRVSAQIEQQQGQIATTENQLRNPDIILARVEMDPEESVADYRARVTLQKGVATPQSNTWLPVQGHYYNSSQQFMYVALSRSAYWHYIWESLSFDPELAQATFLRRAQRSRLEKAYQLEDPDSAINRMRYTLETLSAFQRECCSTPGPEEAPLGFDPDRPRRPATDAAEPPDQTEFKWP